MSMRRPNFKSDPWAEMVRAEYRAAFDATCRTCGEPQHVKYAECDTCLGRGHVIGGDDYRPCPGCSLLRSADNASV